MGRGRRRAPRHFYLLLSRADVTVRSWIMMSIALLAVILDRRAHHSQCRTRRVADPVSRTRKPVRSEFPDILRRRGRPRGPRRSEQQAPRRPGAGCELSVGFCASSGRSSSPTWPPRSSPWPQGPFAIYHFYRLFHYGVIANPVALPLGRASHHVFRTDKPRSHAIRARGVALQLMGLGSHPLVATGKLVGSWPPSPSCPQSPALRSCSWCSADCGCICCRR